jgi:hypothetical protein
MALRTAWLNPVSGTSAKRLRELVTIEGILPDFAVLSSIGKMSG